MQQNNKENRSFKIITAIALCVAVLCLSVAYASLSQQLKINGTAKVVAANWSIDGPDDTNLSSSEPGEGEEGGDGHMDGTITGGSDGAIAVTLEATLKKPGDYAEISIPVKNNGDVDAHLDLITGLKNALTFAGTSTTKEADETIMKDNGGQSGVGEAKVQGAFIWKVYYNGHELKSDDWKDDVAVTERNLPKTNGEATVKVRVEFDTNATKVPANQVTITLPELTFGFSQDSLSE